MGHPRRPEAALRVAAQGEDVAHAACGIRPDDAAQLGHGVPDAREVRHRCQRGLLEHPLGEAHGAVAGAAARAVGDRHEAGSDLLEVTDRVPELRLGGVVLGREELEAEGGTGPSIMAGIDRVKRAARVIDGRRAVCHVAHDRATGSTARGQPTAWSGLRVGWRRLPDTMEDLVQTPTDLDGLRRRVQQAINGQIAGASTSLTEIGPEIDPLVAPSSACSRAARGCVPAFLYWGYRAAGRRRLRRPRAPRERHGVLPGRGPAPRRRDGRSDTRRGMPSAHRASRPCTRRGWDGDGDRFGRGGGDPRRNLCLTWCDELYATCGLPAERAGPGPAPLRPDAHPAHGRAVPRPARVGASAGTASTSTRARSPRARKVIRFKSAKYTIEHPLLHRCARRRASTSDLEPLSRLRPLPRRGVPAARRPARRLRRPGGTGKPAGDDLREGKRTVLIALALDGCRTDDRVRSTRCSGATTSTTAGRRAARHPRAAPVRSGCSRS